VSLISTSTGKPGRTAAQRRALTGILCMLAAGLCFAMMDTLVKWLSPRFSVMQIIFFRSLFAFVPIALQIAHEGGLATLRTNRLRDHLGRSLVGLFSLVGFIYAFGRMPLADVVAIGFSAPIFITALSVPLLGETVGALRPCHDLHPPPRAHREHRRNHVLLHADLHPGRRRVVAVRLGDPEPG
jgi:hypothetical protein